MKRLLLVIAFLWAAVPASAVTRTPSTPAALQSAVDDSRPGDIVEIQAGTYNNPPSANMPRGINITSQSTGQPGNIVRITVAAGATVILNGGFDVNVNVHDVQIDGIPGTLIIDGGGQPHGSNSGACVVGPLLRFRMEKFECRWTDVGFVGEFINSVWKDIDLHHFGIDETGGASKSCYHNQCTNCIADKDICPWCWQSGVTNALIDRCHGVYSGGPSYGSTFEGMTIHNGDGHAFHLYGCGNKTIRNNNLFSNPGTAIALYPHNFCVQDGAPNSANNNNLIYNNLIHDTPGGGINFGFDGNQVLQNTIVNLQNYQGIITAEHTRNAIIANNVIINTSGEAINNDPAAQVSFSSNLCSQSGTGCASVASGAQTFANYNGGDYHPLNGGPACGTGTNLSGTVPLDAEGHTRTVPFDLGYVTCTTTEPEPNPEPGSIVAKYTFEAGSGTNEPDDTGNGHTGTWNTCAGNICRPAGIIGKVAGSFADGRYVQVTNTTGLKPTPAFSLAFRYRAIGTPTEDCDISMGNSYGARITTDGQLLGFKYTGTNWPNAIGGANLNDGMPHALVVSYRSDEGMRVWTDNANVGFQAMTGLVNYTLGPNFQIGRHGNGSPDFDCSAVIDNLYVLDGYCDGGCVNNFYLEQVSQNGLTFSKYRFVAPDAAEGTNLPGIGDNTNIPLNREAKARLLVDLERVGSTLNEFFPIHARVNGGTKTRLTNNCATFPVCIATDTVKNMGDPTGTTLFTGPLTAVPGRYVVDTINTSFLTTIADAQRAVQAYTIGFGSTLAQGDVVQFEPSYSNDTVLDGFPDPLPQVTIQVSGGGSAIFGGTFTGVRVQ